MAATCVGLLLLLAGCEPRADVAGGSRDDRIRAAMAREGVPGVALATLRDCRVDSILLFGTASRETGRGITEATLFEAASLSKPVLAFVFLQAVERGTVPLDEPLAPSFDYPRASGEARYAELTPRHILTHRSGLPNWAREDRTTGERAPLRFRWSPGEAFTYSGEGFQMLQAYLEARAGTPFESMFEEALGADMPGSAFGYAVPAGTEVASAYRRDGSLAADRPLTDHDALSLRTTIGDYARFTARVCAGEGLATATMHDMLRPQSPAPRSAWREFFTPVGAEVSWGLSWGTVVIDGRLLHFHWGDNGAFKNMVVFDRASGDGFVYLTNGEGGLDLLQTIGDPIMGVSLEPIRRWVH